MKLIFKFSIFTFILTTICFSCYGEDTNAPSLIEHSPRIYSSTNIVEIFIGVLSGIVTALLIFSASWIFKNGIAPWYQRLIYKGVDISGDWIFIEPISDNSQRTWRMSLNQSAHKVYGDLSIIRKYPDGKELISNLTLRGELWEGFLNAALRSKSRKRLSFAAALLKVTGGGETISGQYILRNLQNDEIMSRETVFVRNA